jgi:hypothetical protein
MGEVWLRAGVLTQVSNGGEETARLLFVETKQNRTEAQPLDLIREKTKILKKFPSHLGMRPVLAIPVGFGGNAWFITETPFLKC